MAIFSAHVLHQAFLDSVTPHPIKNSTTLPNDQKAWNFGFSLFALDSWRALNLTVSYEKVMRESYRLHVFPETTLTFGLGAAYIAFAGAVKCWKDSHNVKVRDGFGFVEYSSFEQAFGDGFLATSVDVLHYTGPHKPWEPITTIDFRSLQPWLHYMEQEGLPLSQLHPENGQALFTLLASDRTGAY
jgi:lipopolysaccharide biosynthesis glycosyltransferase